MKNKCLYCGEIEGEAPGGAMFVCPKCKDIADKCRAGKLPCPKCGKMMKMYYKPRCFHCEVPPTKTKEHSVYAMKIKRR